MSASKVHARSPDSTTFCAFEKIGIHYNCSYGKTPDPLVITLTRQGSSPPLKTSYSSHPTSTTTFTAATSDDDRKRQPVFECYSEGPTCTPSIASIGIRDSLDASSPFTHELFITFDTTISSSTRPTDPASLLSFLKFYPLEDNTAYAGDMGRGVWSSDSFVLTIPVKGLVVSNAVSGALTVDLAPPPPPVALFNTTGSLFLRVEESGTYDITTSEPAALGLEGLPLATLHIVDCDDDSSVPTEHILTKQSLSMAVSAAPLSPLFSTSARIALSGSSPFTIPSSSVPRFFAISMWIYVPSGQDMTAHRTFFFKGDVSSSERTPSAFFAPGTSKLLLQLSTEDNLEESIESNTEVVEDSWTHYVFKLEEFQYSVYVDGVLDSTLVLSSSAIHNEEDLLVGWAPGLTGPRMIAGNVEIWPAELAPAQIGSMYSAQRSSFSTEINLHPPNLFIRDDDRHVGEMLRKLLSEVYDLMNSETCNDPKERIALWMEAASLNSDVAALHAAEMHLYGTEYENLSKRDEEGFCAMLPVEERSSSAGIEFLRAAANLGNGDAMYKLSMMISSGIGISGMLTLSESTLKPLQPSAPSTSIMIPPLSTSATSQMSMTSISLSLLHQAAAAGNANAAMSLAYKYKNGYGGVKVDPESSSYYAKISADAADVYYHTPGNQPYHEQHRLRVGHEADIKRGEKGEDDGELQYIIMMAEKGDVDFMASYAGMLYWGARGFERDHPKALELWNKAAAHDHVGALCGAASMYVRGEGTEVDVTKAVEYYERAAAMDSATALNGLGYAYFFGQGGLSVDKSKAFTYFMRAADLENDADSLTNAAHCYATGQGIEEDQYQAALLYNKAAMNFGNFDSAIEMGRRFAVGGKGTDRSPEDATNYFMSASRAGESGSLLRKGFDLFMREEYDAALKVYAEAAELGYEVGANNAAYLLDVGAASIDDVGTGDSEGTEIVLSDGAGYDKANPDKLLNKAASLRFHWMAAEENNAESFAAIGDSYYWGVGASQNHDEAFWWYSKSAVAGSIKGTYYVAFMHEHHNRDLDRAISQYSKALRLVESGDNGLEMILLVKFSIWRCEMKKSALWKAVWGYLSGGNGADLAPLPPLPIKRQVEDDDEGGIAEEIKGEGNEGEGEWTASLISSLAKARYVMKDVFFEHKGTVFGFNQSEDLGYKLRYDNIALAGLLLLVLLSFFRALVKRMLRRRRN